MRSVIGFPDPVDEVSARLVAGGVVLMSVATIALDQPWLTVVIAYGFLARVLTGPTLSPLGRLVTQVVRPRLRVKPRPVPGPPKRFAQGIGAVLSTTAAVLALGAAPRARPMACSASSPWLPASRRSPVSASAASCSPG